MGRKRIDQKYENLILHMLYEQDPGTSVSLFEDFFKLGGPDSILTTNKGF